MKRNITLSFIFTSWLEKRILGLIFLNTNYCQMKWLCNTILRNFDRTQCIFFSVHSLEKHIVCESYFKITLDSIIRLVVNTLPSQYHQANSLQEDTQSPVLTYIAQKILLLIKSRCCTSEQTSIVKLLGVYNLSSSQALFIFSEVLFYDFSLFHLHVVLHGLTSPLINITMLLCSLQSDLQLNFRVFYVDPLFIRNFICNNVS